jgi:hypothetical protein
MLENPEGFPAMTSEASSLPTTWECSISKMMPSSKQVTFANHSGSWNFTTDDRHHSK